MGKGRLPKSNNLAGSKGGLHALSVARRRSRGRGLRDQGVPATMIVYAGYGHGITKPKSNRAVLQHNLDWFSHYIWGEPLAADSPLRGRGEAAP
jgi:hypothetical protein